MVKIGYLGYGNIGKQLGFFLKEKYGEQKVEEYFFEDKTVGQSDKHLAFNCYRNEQYKDLEFYICMGYSHLQRKQELFQELKELGRKIPNYIHPSCFIHPTAYIAEGVYLWPMCCIDKDVQVGMGSLMYNGSTVCHDSQVGECSFFGASVTVSGSSQIGSCTFLGTKTAVADGIKVGNRVKAAIGTIITWNVKDDIHVFGYPMKKIPKLNLKR